MEVDDETTPAVVVSEAALTQKVDSTDVAVATVGPRLARVKQDKHFKHLACNFCPYRTNRPGVLKSHKSYHRPQPGNRFKCRFCPYYVSAILVAKQHERLHLDRGEIPPEEDPLQDNSEAPKEEVPDLAEQVKHRCEQCPFVCRNEKAFLYHKQFHEQKPSALFKCEHCPYWVVQEDLLRIHQNVHSQLYGLNMNNAIHNRIPMASPTKSIMSEYCDSIDMATMKQQIINSKIRSCPISPDKFLPIDDDDEEVKMEFDDFENDERFTMNGYVVDEDGQLLKTGFLRKLQNCLQCPYADVRATNLRLHETMHRQRSPKEDEKIFKCDFCSYNTLKKKLLAQHIRVHSLQYQPGQDEVDDFVDPAAATDTEDDADQTGENADEDQLTENAEETKTPVEVVQIMEHEEPVPKKPETYSGPRVESGQLPTDFYIKYLEDSGEHLLERVTVCKFSCDRCPYVTLKRLNFERHISLHGSRQRFTCEFCDYSVHSFQLLLQHKQLHLMPNPNLLSMQSVSNLMKLPEIFADIAVAKNFPMSKDDPVSTQGVHDDLPLYENSDDFVEPKQLYRCERCPFTNTNKDNLLSHLKFHMIRSTLQCSFCDYSASIQDLLDQHVKVHFSGNGQFESVTNDNYSVNKENENKKLAKDSTVTGSDTVNNNGAQELNDNGIVENEITPLVVKEENNNGQSSCVCQYCDRSFFSSDKRLRHEQQHLVGLKC